jgi:hypothetical protein
MLLSASVVTSHMRPFLLRRKRLFEWPPGWSPRNRRASSTVNTASWSTVVVAMPSPSR